jgi:hypothetical protein
MQLNSALDSDRWDPNNCVSLIIDTECGKLVDHPGLFGESVKKAFPSAAEDIRAAGNCLAAECNTAAVFHLMRVAEIGLRSLAHDRRVKLPRKEPLELAAWETVIRDLEKAEDAIRQYPKSPAQQAQYAFHRKAMKQIACFRDVFRNQLMHVREHFGPDHATAIFEAVREFMQTLAGCIAEKSRTPLVWKGKKWADLNAQTR